MNTANWAALNPAQPPALLTAFDAPWWVTAGKTIEPFRGHQGRDHLELNIEILRSDTTRLHAALPSWELHTTNRGQLKPWAPRRPLTANTPWAGPDAA